MKNDQELRGDVIDELRWDPVVRASDISVAVYRGTVTLSGSVRTYLQKYMAEAAARQVTGVKAVVEDIKVQPDRNSIRTDGEIASAVVAAIRLNSELPDKQIKIVVEEGHVTLDGNVDWQYQKDMATDAIRCIGGVRGISNFLFIKPDPGVMTTEVTIRKALERQADLQGTGIQVVVNSSRVILKGKVRTWLQRWVAEKVAMAAPGITAVKNELEVGF